MKMETNSPKSCLLNGSSFARYYAVPIAGSVFVPHIVSISLALRKACPLSLLLPRPSHFRPALMLGRPDACQPFWRKATLPPTALPQGSLTAYTFLASSFPCSPCRLCCSHFVYCGCGESASCTSGTTFTHSPWGRTVGNGFKGRNGPVQAVTLFAELLDNRFYVSHRRGF